MRDPFSVSLTPAPRTAPVPLQARPPSPVLEKTTNDRMAGSIPVWRPPTSAKAEVTQALEQATAPAPPDSPSGFAAALSDARNSTPPPSEAFGFGDIIDMINPLQHIPLVGTLYRNLTGDDIRPVARIMGGTLFGGPVGAAAGLANVIVEHETGSDITDNVMAFTDDDPARDMNALAPASGAAVTTDELPGTVLSFADLGASSSAKIAKPASAFRSFVLND